MRICEIPHASPLYDSSKRLRDAVLREPIGLVLNEKDIAGEELQTHIAAIDDSETVVGTVLLKPLEKTHIKLRQMAVSGLLQGAGLGRKLVAFAEEHARSHGFASIELNARVYARGFYEKLGYTATGEEFTEVGLATVKMVKDL